jgi:thiol-disulfide isomerase/thioredoxin
MNSRIAAAVCYSLAVFWAGAQPADHETPPDQKAYMDASKISDPAKKIEAMEKVAADFPDSDFRGFAEQSVLSTLVKKMPDQLDRIRQSAKSQYAHATDDNKGSVASRIADVLLSGPVLLKDAEDYAKKGVDAMQQSKYVEDQRKAYEKRKQTAPAEEELVKRFQQSRANRVATLGQIELKLSQTVKGRKLLEEAYAANPGLTDVAGTLGEMAAKAGTDSQAMDYLIPARLSGRATDTANAALESIYRKTHNGTLDGLEDMLDTEYRKRYPNPIKVEAFQEPKDRSKRMVLAEVFTGSGCPPCAGADVAFDAAMERYPHNDLAVIMYHQHVPRPDPMTNPDTQARNKYYAVRGVPTFAIDGKDTIGGNSRENAGEVFDKFKPDIEAELIAPAEAGLKLDAYLDGDTVKVIAFVSDVKSDSSNLKLQVALVEKELRYNGENGIRFHPMVVRAMGQSFDVLPGSWSTVERAFDLNHVSAVLKEHLDDYEAKGHRGEAFKFKEKKYQIDRRDLMIVAFIQDDKTKHVLQSAFVDLNPEPPAPRIVSESNQQ